MKKPQIFPSSFPYASFVNYSPRGLEELSRKSRSVCFAIKNDSSNMIAKAAKSLAGDKGDKIRVYFGENPIFVPTPRSSLLQPNSLWPSLRIIDEMLKAQIRGSREILLQRHKAVNKSSTSSPGNRPGIEEHINSIICNTEDLMPNNFVLVDDVITKGSTLFACANILQLNFPRSTVKTFALIKTQGLIPDIENFVDPSIGKISYDGHDVSRTP